MLTLLSEGRRHVEICIALGITERSFKRALDKIRERANVESSGVALLYERALRRNAEAERAAVEARFHALMDGSFQAILVVEGRSGLIRQVNENASRMFGYPKSELIGMKVESLVPSEQRQVHDAYRIGFLRSARKREMGYHPPIIAVRKDGSGVEIEIGLTATPENDDVMVVCEAFESGSPARGEPRESHLRK